MTWWVHVSHGGSERKGDDVPGTDSPTAVVHQQVGDDLAALQIETVEVRQSVEVAALEHGTTLVRVVEAEHGGQEHAFSAAQDAESVAGTQHVGTQIPLALGVVQAFARAVAKPLDAMADWRVARKNSAAAWKPWLLEWC